MDNKMTARYYSVRPASESDFEKCNACGHPFKKRGASIDMKDFREHKSACVPNFSKE